MRDYYHLPSDKRFAAVTEKLNLNITPVNSSTTQEISNYNKMRDSLSEILSKSRLKRMVDRLVKSDIDQSEFTTNYEDQTHLRFSDHLKIKYMNEPEEDNFRRGPNKLQYQVSVVNLLTNSALIDRTGTLVNPLDMFIEGYWSYEKIADTLPLDYEPKD